MIFSSRFAFRSVRSEELLAIINIAARVVYICTANI